MMRAPALMFHRLGMLQLVFLAIAVVVDVTPATATPLAFDFISGGLTGEVIADPTKTLNPFSTWNFTDPYHITWLTSNSTQTVNQISAVYTNSGSLIYQSSLVLFLFQNSNNSLVGQIALDLNSNNYVFSNGSDNPIYSGKYVDPPTGSVPETSSILLLGVGLLALAGYQRLRRQEWAEVE